MHGILKSIGVAATVTAVANGAALKTSRSSGPGIQLNVKDPNSIKQAASTVVNNMLKTYYVGDVQKDQTGLLPKPYYWWESGAMFGGLVDYWAYTRDDSHASTIAEALLSQAAPTLDFNMPNQRFDMGNDDQGFWALAAMSALEEGLPVPEGSDPSLWQQLTVNCFNEFVSRWDESTCKGGLRWQVYPENKGYTYKSTIANGAFMQLGARLARYTGNETYGEWADKVFSWLEDVKFIDTDSWRVFDGAGVDNNCADISQAHWTYDAGATLYTAAVMYYITADNGWYKRFTGLLNSTADHFFTPGQNSASVMYEAQCEMSNKCNTDQQSFKGYLSRWLGKSALLLPEVAPQVQALLEASAIAAAASCSGDGNQTCGTKWYQGTYDGTSGLGQDISAYETLQSLLIFHGQVAAPGTADSIAWNVKVGGLTTCEHPRKGHPCGPSRPPPDHSLRGGH